MKKQITITALLTSSLLFDTYAQKLAPHMDTNDSKTMNLDDIKTMENITEGLEETIYTSTDIQSFSNEEFKMTIEEMEKVVKNSLEIQRRYKSEFFTFAGIRGYKCIFPFTDCCIVLFYRKNN